MGMDVFGKNPTSEEGKHFRNNGSGWHSLADYCAEIAPDVTAHCRLWHSNDGDGLGGEDSLALADILQREIDSGRCANYARIRESNLERLPDEPCQFCGATGTRKPPPHIGPGDVATGIECNGCGGRGFRRPWSTYSWFSVKNVQTFATFLRGCGGFEIW